MKLLDKLKKEMISAMKEKDKEKLNTLRAVKGAMQMEVINNKREESEELLLDVINKQIKMRNDSISEFKKASRQDLIDSYQNEINILNEYMPSMLSESELSAIILEGIKVTGASNVKEMGLVMREITPKIKNRCNMKEVTEIIREKLL